MDPFSTAAAAISVLSLAIQLVDTVQKVKEFWKSIKDAPADVSDIVNELDCILSILQELGEQDGERGPPGNVLVVKALQACGIYVRRLAACVRDLNPGLASGKGVRTWTSLKVVLRRERIQSSQEALERVKSNLILAQLIRQDQARVHDMRNVQASIACIGSSLQEMQTEKSQTVVVRSTETGLVEDSTPDVGERHERNVQYGCLRSGSVVLPSFPPRESGGVVQPRRDSPAVQPQLKPVVEHDSTLKSGPFEELPIARSEWFSPGSMTRSRFKKISVPLQQHTYTTSLASVHYQLKAISLVIGSVNDGDYVDAEQQIETSISIHPKPWLLGRGFALSYRTSGENWMPHFGIQFRQYNIRFEEALIFEFCSYGNIEGVKSLLRRGDASPFDTDPDGWTPLHYAAQAQDDRICKLLIQHGASGSVLDLSNRSALHSALSLSSRNITGIRRSDRYARPGSCIDTDLGDTIRVLVEHTEVDMNAESADGNTCFDLAVRKTDARPFARWLLQKAPLDFDVDHRNTRGKTLLMQQASCTTDIVSIKDLLALGADLDARVLDMPEAYCRDIGATALHFAGMHYRTSPQGRFFEKAQYLLCQGADPHVMSSCGHTVTDWVLEYHHYTIFLHWRRILLELGFDLKAFVRKEIDVHADIPWYASNNVDEYVLAHFGFSPRFDESTGAIEFLTLSEEKALEEVQSEHDSDSGSEEIVLFDDSDTEHEQCLSSNSDYQSAAEDMPLTTSQKLLENAQRRTLAGLSRFTSGSSDTRRSAHLWRPYKIMLESDDPEGWTGQKWTDG